MTHNGLYGAHGGVDPKGDEHSQDNGKPYRWSTFNFGRHLCLREKIKAALKPIHQTSEALQVISTQKYFK